MDPSIEREARSLFEDYNRFRLQTSAIAKLRSLGKFVRPLKLEPKGQPSRLPIMVEMVEWCRAQGIDPRLWLYLLFRRRRWLHAPLLARSHLCSEKMVDGYHAAAHRALDGYRFQLLEHRPQRPFDPNVDLSYAAEAAQRRFQQANDPYRCMSETVERTLGWHPQSRACKVCPIAKACQDNLRALVPEFDLVALREGRITPEAAQAAVLRASF